MYLHPHMPSIIRERMQTYRKRKVGYHRVSAGIERYFGHFEDEPFERLYGGCPDPWMLRLHWAGAEARGIEKLVWFETLAQAVGYLIDRVDSHRLYPTSIADKVGGLWLFKDEQPIFSLEPLSFDEPDSNLLTQCREWVHSDDKRSPLDFLARLSGLPGFKSVRSPVFSDDKEGYGVKKCGPKPGAKLFLEQANHFQSTGLLEFEPLSAAVTVQKMYADQNIAVTTEVAQADLAYYFGFDTFAAMQSQWERLAVFDPVLLTDNRTGTVKMYRSALHGLAALGGPDSPLLSVPSTHAWTVQMGPFIGRLRLNVVAWSHLHERSDEVALSLTGFEASHWGEGQTLPPNANEPQILAAWLGKFLGTDLGVEAQITLTNKRRRANTIRIGRVLVGHLKGYGRYGGRTLLEVLKDDGWHDVPEANRLFERHYYDYREGYLSLPDGLVLVIGKRGAAQLGRLDDRGKNFHVIASFPGAASHEVEQLKVLLEMRPHDKLAGTFCAPAMRTPDFSFEDMMGCFESSAMEFAAFKPYTERLKHRQRESAEQG